MTHSPDNPSSDRIDAEAPSAPSGEDLNSELTSPSEPNPAAGSSEPPRLPRRRRRRRRPTRPADPVEAAAPRQAQTEPAATTEDAPESGDLAVSPPPEGAPRHRRRRRRRPPRPPEASATDADKTGIAPATQGMPAGAPGPPRNRSASYRGPRNRGARDRRGGDEQPSGRRPAGDSRPAPDRRSRAKGPPSRNDRRQRRDGAEPRKKPEPRLYALEAIVDRGFEDLVDAAEDNLTRRVHWTIIKRTVADQESGKPISATYVLKRDGVDTEFPGLGAARAAANKTIVHPEKLTMSKAEHAAEHAASKK